MTLSLVRIRSFIAIAEQGSFRRAAEELGLSQPALSAHVRDLETYLGTPLLSRTTRRVRTTPAGDAFLARSRRGLHEIESVALELKDQAALQHGRVVAACIPTIAAHTFPRVIRAFRDAHRHITVRVLDEVSGELMNRVLSAEADFGLGPAPDRRHDLAFSPLFQDHFVAVFPREHELAGGDRVELDRLVAYPIIAMERGTNVRDLVERAFAERGHALTPAFELQQHYTIGGMVEAGLGITILPSHALPILNHPLLARARVVNPEIIRTVGIVRRKGESFSPAAETFLAMLTDAFGGTAEP